MQDDEKYQFIRRADGVIQDIGNDNPDLKNCRLLYFNVKEGLSYDFTFTSGVNSYCAQYCFYDGKLNPLGDMPRPDGLSNKVVAYTGIVAPEGSVYLCLGTTAGTDYTVTIHNEESFINTYLQKESVYKTLVADNNYEALQLLTEINSEVNCIKEENLVNDNPDSMISYYFSLIAMAILFGGYFGSKCGREMNANTTNKGLRKCISSVPKVKFIIAEFLATITLHIISLLVLLLYMVLVLRLNIGNQFGYIALTCMVA